MDIRGDEHDETLEGTSGADTIDGGPGDDTLRGLFGFDTYLFGTDDGGDVIDDAAPGPDALIVSGYASTVATLSFTGSLNADLLLDFGGGDSVLIRNGSASAFGVETITFADAVTLTQAELRARVLEAARTDGPDLIVGTPGADTLDGGPGDDTLQGLLGPDAYRYGVGAFQGEVQRLEQTLSSRPCQARTGTPRPGTGSRGIFAG